MKITTISLFPEIFDSLSYGVIGRATRNKLVAMKHLQLRSYSKRTDRRVDDHAYGGSCGMLIRPDVMHDAIMDAQSATTGTVIQLCPTGQQFSQEHAHKLSLQNHLIFLCGRYEGMDHRIEQHIQMKFSIGDFVISGGELAAATMIDSIVRLMPSVLGNACSAENDSYQDDLLDYPQYTRPYNWHRQCPPDVLVSGNHRLIQDWQEQQKLGITWLHRPDLLKGRWLTKKQVDLLHNYLKNKFEE